MGIILVGLALGMVISTIIIIKSETNIRALVGSIICFSLAISLVLSLLIPLGEYTGEERHISTKQVTSMTAEINGKSSYAWKDTSGHWVCALVESNIDGSGEMIQNVSLYDTISDNITFELSADTEVPVLVTSKKIRTVTGWSLNSRIRETTIYKILIPVKPITDNDILE